MQHLDRFHAQTINQTFAINKLSENILREAMRFRRVYPSVTCSASSCQKCLKPHLQKIFSAVKLRKSITFILPAFPGKSPNTRKVFGPLPDMAEQCALKFLENLCNKIQKIYNPGAKIIICSDGRVFSDIVGIKESNVSAYQYELQYLLEKLNLSQITTFSLDKQFNKKTFSQLRHELMKYYGSPLETLKQKVKRGGNGYLKDIESHRIYCGITRFLVEDAIFPGQNKSRNSIQKDCRIRAYEVIRRSNAWSELIAERFPHAVRLSIHPQTCGSSKLGIQLLGTATWLTPWHGVAVDTGQNFTLMKRWEAEKLPVFLVSDRNRASYYKTLK